jgi:hypothetical protein
MSITLGYPFQCTFVPLLYGQGGWLQPKVDGGLNIQECKIRAGLGLGSIQVTGPTHAWQ